MAIWGFPGEISGSFVEICIDRVASGKQYNIFNNNVVSVKTAFMVIV